jgi:hypothetical protein
MIIILTLITISHLLLALLQFYKKFGALSGCSRTSAPWKAKQLEEQKMEAHYESRGLGAILGCILLSRITIPVPPLHCL